MPAFSASGKRTSQKVPVVTYLLLGINIILFLFQLGDDMESPINILKWGANFAPYTLGDEWWRFITSMFLHFGWLHLIANMYTLYLLGNNLEVQIGPMLFTAIYFMTGLFAGIASVYWNLFVFSGGASGALFGLYSFDIVLLLVEYKNERRKLASILLNFAIYVTLVTVLGRSFHFDNAAHFGGLFAGIALAIVYLTTISSKPACWIGYAGFLFLGIFAYLKLPPFQKDHFDLFQYFVKTEEATLGTYNQDYASDQVFFQELSQVAPKWDSLIELTHQPDSLPEALKQDQKIIRMYATKRKQEIKYWLTGIQRESYIYYDSLEAVREAINSAPPFNYPLKLAESTKSPGTNTATSEQPGKIAKAYYDSIWKPTEEWKAEYYRGGYKDSMGHWNGPVRDYYKNGNIQMKGRYKRDIRNGVFIYYSEDQQYEAAGRYSEESKVGKWEYFHDNGKIAKEIRYTDRAYLMNAWDEEGNKIVSEGNGSVHQQYANGITKNYEKYHGGLMDSIAYGYYKDGSPHFQEVYENGHLVQGLAYAKDGSEIRYDISTYIPYPEGGMDKFQQYTKKARGEYAYNDSEGGKVELIFSVGPEGEVYSIKVLRSDNDALNEIAKDILKNGPKWVPAKEHGTKLIAAEGYAAIYF